MWQPLVLYRSGKATGMNRIFGLKLHGLPSTIFAGAICIFYTVRREGTEFSTRICPSEYEVCTWSSSLNFEGYDHTINFEGICSTTTRMSSHEFPADQKRECFLRPCEYIWMITHVHDLVPISWHICSASISTNSSTKFAHTIQYQLSI